MQFKIDSNIARGNVTAGILLAFLGAIAGIGCLFQYISEPYAPFLTLSITGFAACILAIVLVIFYSKFRAVTVTDNGVNIRLGFSNKTYLYAEIIEIRYATRKDDLPRGIDKDEILSTILLTTTDHDTVYLTCENDMDLYTQLQEQFEKSKQR